MKKISIIFCLLYFSLSQAEMEPTMAETNLKTVELNNQDKGFLRNLAGENNNNNNNNDDKSGSQKIIGPTIFIPSQFKVDLDLNISSKFTAVSEAEKYRQEESRMRYGRGAVSL